MAHILDVRDHPQWIRQGAAFFSERWSIDKAIYAKSMEESLLPQNPLPRWFLLMEGGRIIGGCGIIANDFMVAPTFTPWLCALYVEAAYRGGGLGAALLYHSRREAGLSGFDTLYLNTDHIGYYEKYGWRYEGDFPHQAGEAVRVYAAEALFAPHP